jgi:hypothetical protein
MQSEAIEARGDNGIGLRVEFVWRGDRFGHAISWINEDGVAQPLLESIEGLGTDAWPASPPLQSLTLHTLPSGHPAALLVGMAGRSHWSASVEATAGRATLQFDIACRHSAQPEWLGSRYRFFGEWAKRVSIVADDARMNYTASVATIEPSATNENLPTTRWRYTVSIRLTSDR